jgi:methyl-accepting chemotaxis protein
VTTETFHLTGVIIAGVILFMQLAVLSAILLGILRLSRTAREKTTELSTTIMPVLNSTRDLLTTVNALVARIEPRLDAAATDLAEITRSVHAQATRFESTANDLQQRVHRQAVRIDGMAVSVLDSVDYAANKVSDAMRGPARRISGAVAAITAFVDSLGKPAPRRPVTPAPAREDKDVAV